MHYPDSRFFRHTLLVSLLAAAFGLAACGGGSSSDDSPASSSSVSSSSSSSSVAALPKNVILMISDGASWGTWEMAAHWRNGGKANDLAAYKDLPVRLGMTTFPLNTATSPTNNATAMVSYDPAQAWDTTAVTAETDAYAAAIAGYQYLRKNYTDSAAAGTALASGVKTFNNAINYDNFGQPVSYITEYAKQQGKATGVISSVQLSHATPAAFSAKRVSRNNLPEIAAQQLRNGVVDLLMAPGHPGYDSNGIDLSSLDATACAASSACKNRYDTIAAAEWSELKAGTLIPAGASAPWTLIENKSAFEQLAAGNISVAGPLIGIPKVRWTLQQGREAAVVGKDPSQPSGVKKIESVPDLATMSEGALNYLSRNPNGFFVMIEGGAVDWAAHANQTDRIIEEGMDFNAAVARVQQWVEKNSSWDETLLIVTTDHGNGLPLSPASDTVAFDPVKAAGQGNLPLARYWTDQHTNEIVRLWAKGAGSDKGADFVKGKDPKFAQVVGQNGDGAYIDNTDIAKWVQAGFGGVVSCAETTASAN